MSGYGYQTYQQMLVEERGEAWKDLKDQLQEKGAKIDALKAELQLVRERGQQIYEEIDTLAKGCVRIKNLMNKQHATN